MAQHGGRFGGGGGLTCWLGIGLGVGRRPPPGRIPATAFAGANSDKALASSGMEPTQKPHGRQTAQGTSTTASKISQTLSHISRRKNKTGFTIFSFSVFFFFVIIAVAYLLLGHYHTTPIEHCRGYITWTCFLSHEPNVSKHSGSPVGCALKFHTDVYWNKRLTWAASLLKAHREKKSRYTKRVSRDLATTLWQAVHTHPKHRYQKTQQQLTLKENVLQVMRLLSTRACSHLTCRCVT